MGQTGVDRAGRAAAVLVAVLAIVQLERLTSDPEARLWQWLLGLAFSTAAVLIAAVLWRSEALEARLAAVVVALGAVGAQLLVATVGAPGEPPAGWSVDRFALMALAVAVVLLIAAETLRRARRGRRSYPYA